MKLASEPMADRFIACAIECLSRFKIASLNCRRPKCAELV
jgi:hypothetical protein